MMVAASLAAINIIPGWSKAGSETEKWFKIKHLIRQSDNNVR